MVVKPLDASGGFGVFHVRRGDPNTGAILEQATNLGRRWTVAQKYLPEVRAGDKRIVLVRRRAAVRGAARAGARTTRAATCTSAPSRWRPRSTSATRRSSRALGPRLRERGHFFVGLDVIGGWLTEINVTSPTGIVEANALYRETYEVTVIEKMEEKIAALRQG